LFTAKLIFNEILEVFGIVQTLSHIIIKIKISKYLKEAVKTLHVRQTFDLVSKI